MSGRANSPPIRGTRRCCPTWTPEWRQLVSFCPWCGAENKRGNRTVFCSHKCQRDANAEKMRLAYLSSHPKTERTCPECKQPFVCGRSDKVFCCERCRAASANRRNESRRVQDGRNRKRKELDRRNAGVLSRAEYPGSRPELIGNKWYMGDAKRHRIRSLKSIGWTKEEYQRAYQEQDGKCFLCGEAPADRSLHADHDHETGKPRRLLCGLCNRYIGVIENKQMLEKLVNYLRSNGEEGNCTEGSLQCA